MVKKKRVKKAPSRAPVDRAACPRCGFSYLQSFINLHLDNCLVKEAPDAKQAQQQQQQQQPPDPEFFLDFDFDRWLGCLPSPSPSLSGGQRNSLVPDLEGLQPAPSVPAENIPVAGLRRKPRDEEERDQSETSQGTLPTQPALKRLRQGENIVPQADQAQGGTAQTLLGCPVTHASPRSPLGPLQPGNLSATASTGQTPQQSWQQQQQQPAAQPPPPQQPRGIRFLLQQQNHPSLLAVAGPLPAQRPEQRQRLVIRRDFLKDVDKNHNAAWATQAAAAPDPEAALKSRIQHVDELQRLRELMPESQQQQLGPSLSPPMVPYRHLLGAYQESTSRYPHIMSARVLSGAVQQGQPGQGLRFLDLGGGDSAENTAQWLQHFNINVKSYHCVDMMRISPQLGLPQPRKPQPPAASGQQRQPPAVTHETVTYQKYVPLLCSIDGGIMVNGCSSLGSAREAAKRLHAALRPGAPVVVAGSGSDQASLATAVALELEAQGFTVVGCYPDMTHLEHCSPDHETTIIVLRKGGGAAPTAPSAPPHHPSAHGPPEAQCSLAQDPAAAAFAWQQQQLLHQPPAPLTSPAATSKNGIVYGVTAPGKLPTKGKPIVVSEPAHLAAAAQWALEQETGYVGSTLRDWVVRLVEHFRDLVAGVHPSMQQQEQPLIDLLRLAYPGFGGSDSEAFLEAYASSFGGRCFVIATVTGKITALVDVVTGATEQACIDSTIPFNCNVSTIVDPRFHGMPGSSQALGALGGHATAGSKGYNEEGKCIAAVERGKRNIALGYGFKSSEHGTGSGQDAQAAGSAPIDPTHIKSAVVLANYLERMSNKQPGDSRTEWGHAIGAVSGAASTTAAISRGAGDRQVSITKNGISWGTVTIHPNLRTITVAPALAFELGLPRKAFTASIKPDPRDPRSYIVTHRNHAIALALAECNFKKIEANS